MIVLGPGAVVHEDELVYRASRSGGPGGQNVNKTETRVELYFDVAKSPGLTDFARARLLSALAARLDSDGVLRVVSSEARSQSRNKEAALERLKEWVQEALRPRRLRKRTKPTRGSKERRLAEKRHRSDLKSGRRITGH